jgi:hypothetical protein
MGFENGYLLIINNTPAVKFNNRGFWTGLFTVDAEFH